MTTLTPLRHIHVSGGFFTENILLHLRDKPDDHEEMKWSSFGSNWQAIHKEFSEVWEWVKLTFDAIVGNLDSWSVEERFTKWVGPLLRRLGHQPEPFSQTDAQTAQEGGEEEENILNKIRLSHKMHDDVDPVLLICTETNLDEKVETNYQKKSQHDHLQRYLLLNPTNTWGFLTNGRVLRLLGEYSNVYAKGYVEFDLENIIANRDEQEFRVFFGFAHASRFDFTYGLDSKNWMKDLEKDLKKQKNLPSFSSEILEAFEATLNDFLVKARKFGTSSVNSGDSEIFFKNVQVKGIPLNVEGRDFLLKQLEQVISEINQNECILARLQKKSTDQGIEIGNKLKENVRAALELLGEGLVQSNPDFARDLHAGHLDIRDFFQELLRIAYRFIFAFYAESKKILPDINTLYYSEVGLSYVRQRAEQTIRDDRDIDLWHRLQILFHFLDTGNKELGINAFSGPLFDPANVPLIEKYQLTIPNSTLLHIIQHLTMVETGEGRQKIDYVNIGEEEIGGIYESLLDFQPRYLQRESPTFHFVLDSIDTERKGTGTYYTSKGLIDSLLKTALLPVVEKRLEGANSKEEKLHCLLEIKVCDPACGGGSFLLAALDYLGKKYAQIEGEEEFPEEEVLRESRRKVLQHCIYGVDLNPMAIELAKISLWVKACVKDKPLTFLDNHLKMGDSLIGFAKKQEISSIPLTAFNAAKGNTATGIPDEDGKILNKVKNVAKNYAISPRSKGIQQTLFAYRTSENLVEHANKIFEMEELDIKSIKEKTLSYLKLKQTKTWEFLNLQANIWTSSFFWEMNEDFGNNVPTDLTIQKAKQGNFNEEDDFKKEITRLQVVYRFFNWYLEFPEVFQKEDSGFDCILMNPPWEVLTLKEMEFFAGKDEIVLNTQTKAEREKTIKSLIQRNPSLHNEFIIAHRQLKKRSYYLKESGFYEFSSQGSLNTFALFIERGRLLINQKGKIGCIALTSILTGENLSGLFQHLVSTNSMDSAFNFVNQMKIFPVHSSLTFSLITLSHPKIQNKKIIMAFNIAHLLKFQRDLESFENQVKDSALNKLESGTIFELTATDFELFNPNTKNVPIFNNFKDLQLVKTSYIKAPVLIKRDNSGNILLNPWQIILKRMFDAALDSDKFVTQEQLKKIGAKPVKKEGVGGIWETSKEEINQKIRYLPLYSGSSIWFYDHRFNEVIPKKDTSMKRKADYFPVSEQQHQNPNYDHIPIFWIKKEDTKDKIAENLKRQWLIGFRSISASTNQRGFIISAIPAYGATNSINIILFENFRQEIICFLANLSSIPFDFIVRNKLSGVTLNHFIVEQFPAFPPDIYSSELLDEIRRRALELIYTAWDMQPFAIDFGISADKTPYKWDTEIREKLKAELDAIFALMYGYSYEDFEYVLDTFTALKTRELRELGEFRSKRLALEAYNIFNADPKLGPLFRLEYKTDQKKL